MTTSQTLVKSEIIELSTVSFKTFCDDISGMFGVEMSCDQQEQSQVTLTSLSKDFPSVIAINSMKSEGVLEGNLQFVFSEEGLFTLAGLIIKPEQMQSTTEKSVDTQEFMTKVKNGTIESAESMRDSISEAFNLLVGSWDRVFHERMDGHKHFAQSDLFICELSNAQATGLSIDQESLFIRYKMKIGDYPPFDCGVIYPKVMSERFIEPEPETEDAADEKAEPEAEVKEEVAEEKTEPETETKEETTEEKAEPETEVKEEAAEEKAQEKQGTNTEHGKTDAESVETSPVSEETELQKQAEKAEAQASVESGTESVSEEHKEQSSEGTEPEAADETKESAVSPEPVAETEAAETKPLEAKSPEPVESTNAEEGVISETIKKMSESEAELPGETKQPVSANTAQPLGAVNSIVTLSANDIMQKDIVWCDGEQSVQQVLTKMQQYDSGYVLIGHDQIAEGIVSKTDITSAVSIYLKPMFSKWRQPGDDATLQIKIKWIMSRPVETIGIDSSLLSVLSRMQQSSLSALPVIDCDGKIQGIITVSDIFRVILKNGANITTSGKAGQSPPLI